MIVTGLILVAVAALVHVFIFYLESIAWTTPRAREAFGTSPAEAQTTKSLAFNQGFYNLFLAISIVLGIIVFAVGAQAVGATLIFVGAGSMVAAGLVLLLSARALRRAALIQLTPPALGIIALAIGLAL